MIPKIYIVFLSKILFKKNKQKTSSCLLLKSRANEDMGYLCHVKKNKSTFKSGRDILEYDTITT